MLSPSFNNACVIFGDSITQTSASGTYFQRISEYYERKLDVVNRGFSGYNTRQGLAALQHILARKQDFGQKIRLLTIWFGANDSVIPPGCQHIPLASYSNHLNDMVNLVSSPESPFYSPSTKIILITPPPFLHDIWRSQHVAWALREGRATTAEEAVHGYEREPEVTRRYAEACVEVAKRAEVEWVDVHTGMLEAAGGGSEEDLRHFFTDGLHLTSKGYEIVFNLIKGKIESAHPELAPHRIPSCMPDYAEFVEGEEEDLVSRCQTDYRKERPKYDR